MELTTEGVKIVKEMVNRMNTLNQSAQRITDIIEVIDGVAFQTNILALNASVEAARAGEQGRGFSVVADEIRNLAQRSADSAHGIKNLITSSVEQVKEGTKLADKVLVSMDTISQSIRSVTTLMSDIRDASREQNSSIQQINIAINEMDKVTQENSALVEEAKGTAKSLQEEAQEMYSIVEIFKISEDKSQDKVKINQDKREEPHIDISHPREETKMSVLKTEKNVQKITDDEWSKF